MVLSNKACLQKADKYKQSRSTQSIQEPKSEQNLKPKCCKLLINISKGKY